MTAPVLEVRGLVAGYEGAAVIRNVTLTIGKGEVVVLLGPNGAGKTTTLQAISGLVQVMSGSVWLNAEDLTECSPTQRSRRGIAHVPEGRGIFAGLTVAEHFRLGHRGEHLKAEVAYGYFPALAKVANRRAGVLSGGEQQMLAVGRALARQPSVLLLDELSLGLAPIVVETLLPVIRSYATESGCSVLLVEQHIHLALEVADRGYLLANGEIAVEKTAKELQDDKVLIAASYLGKSEFAASNGNAASREGKTER